MPQVGGRPLAGVVFVVLVGLVAAGITIHALEGREDKGEVHLSVPSDIDQSSAPPVGPANPPSTTDPSTTIPTPPPQAIQIGAAICRPEDYTLSLHRPARGENRYVLTATAKNHSCVLTDYPKVTVDAGRRELRPYGTVIDGLGQPGQAIISRTGPATSYLQVDGTTCNPQPLHDLRMDGKRLVLSLRCFCKLQESWWVPVGDSLTANVTAGAPCKSYDVHVAQVAAPVKRGNSLIYTLRVQHKRERTSACVLAEFPHLTASPANGLPHQLTVSAKPPFREIPLTGSKSATVTVRIVGTRCSKPGLSTLQLENQALDFIGATAKHPKPVDIEHWCSITESYWLPGP